MAIVGWPDDVPKQRTILCVVCGEEKHIDELTVGICDVQGRQRFACNTHFLSSGQFIAGWADFLALQQSLESDIQGIAWD